MPVTLHSMSENSVLFCEMREIWCRWGLSFGFICLLKIEVILRISDYVCVGLFKHYLKNNTASARWLPVVWRGWFRCDGKIIAYVTGTAFFAVQLNVLCALSDFQAVKWQLNVTEVLLVPAVMSADAFVSVCRPVYHTNLTHVAALISSFFLRGNGLVIVVTVFIASTLACLYSVVKREQSVRMWRFAAPVCDGRNSLIWRLENCGIL